jgi:hypothetical protein
MAYIMHTYEEAIRSKEDILFLAVQLMCIKSKFHENMQVGM